MNEYEREIYYAARSINRARSGCLTVFLTFIAVYVLVWGGAAYGIYSWVQSINDASTTAK